MLPISALAEDGTGDGIFEVEVSGNNIKFKSLSDTEVQVGDGTNLAIDSSVSTLVIPPTVTDEKGRTYTVTKIGNSAFKDCTALRSIEIPASVTSIEDYAFNGSGLKSVTFAKASKITTIGYAAFMGCSALRSIEIPASVTSIGYVAFYGSGLESVKFTKDSKITIMGNTAFAGCSALRNIKIPASVTSIDEGAFIYCTALRSIEIPTSVTSIGEEAFHGC